MASQAPKADAWYKYKIAVLNDNFYTLQSIFDCINIK